MTGIRLDQHTKNCLSCALPYPWVPSSTFSYLGTQITTPSSNILRLNYEALLTKLQNLCSSPLSIRASWAGKIALAKMFLIPHVLYFLRTLPVSILTTQLSSLIRVINTFIWDSKNPRIKHPTVCTATFKAGLGVPDIKQYYKAILLTQAKHWWSLSEHPHMGSNRRNFFGPLS